jgi:hypothetical protein
MKNIFKIGLFIMAFFLSQIALSQTIEKSSVDNGGASVSNANIQMVYTIGEVTVQEVTAGNIRLSEGFIGPNIFEDTSPLTVVAPADVTLECVMDSNPVSTGFGTATDNCDANPVITYSDELVPGACPNKLTIKRTWTATDAVGNMASGIQTIIVEDYMPPVAPVTPADLVLQCADDVPAKVDLTATDNCSGNITVSPLEQVTPGNYINNFILVRTWTFTDECDNTSSISQTITVEDNTPPVAPVTPADITLQCADDVPAPEDLTATDNCSGNITVSPSEQVTPGNYINNFILVRTWTFTDECENTSSISQTITVEDNTPPDPDVEQLITIQGQCSVEVSTTPIATDNCSGAIAGITSDPLIYTEQGTYTITWSYDDGNGNTFNQIQTVIVEDMTPPVIEVLSASPVALWPPNSKYETITIDQCVAAVSDNCFNLSMNDVHITKVTSDEADDTKGNDKGGAKKKADIVISDDCRAVDLRRETLGNGNGRVYTIHLSATDDAGNEGTATCLFAVKVGSPNQLVVADTPVYEVYSNCSANTNGFIDEITSNVKSISDFAQLNWEDEALPLESEMINNYPTRSKQVRPSLLEYRKRAISSFQYTICRVN